MRKLLMSIIFPLLIISCSDKEGEDHTHEEETAYSISIMSPTTDDQVAGESIHVHVNFDEENEGTIHHINVQIINETSGEIIYNEPQIPHVHVSSGHYEWHDDFTLDVAEDSNLMITAKVWGHEEGVAETIESLTFLAK